MSTGVVEYIETKNAAGRKIRLVKTCDACAYGNDTGEALRSPCRNCLGAGKSKFKLAPELKKCPAGKHEVQLG